MLPLLAAIDQTHAATTGKEIVAGHSIAFDTLAVGATQLMAADPLLGNGDVGLMQSGPAAHLTYSIGKNDF